MQSFSKPCRAKIRNLLINLLFATLRRLFQVHGRDAGDGVMISHLSSLIPGLPITSSVSTSVISWLP